MKGDRYQESRFSVPASGGTPETCASVGHAFADVRGKCVRCGKPIRTLWGDEIKDRERVAEAE